MLAVPAWAGLERTHQEHSWAFTETVTGSGKVLSHLTDVKTHKTITSKAQVREVKACLYSKLTLEHCFQEGLLCPSQEKLHAWTQRVCLSEEDLNCISSTVLES